MKLSFLGLVTFTVLSISSVSSLACSPRDAVKDYRGSVVKDSNGNCVRTMWVAKTDPCAKHHGAVGSVKMDERKIYFDFDRAALKSSEHAKLQKVASELKDNSVKKIKIIGYTDKMGSEGHNLALSESRAQVVNKYLNTLLELKGGIVEIKGLGKSHQVKECTNIQEREELIMCLAPNRRVEIEIDYNQAHKKN
jgi:outer membrane protein OmpA-like peptidoglycan-associated protein